MKRQKNNSNFIYSLIFILSFAIVIFLAWFIYLKPEAQASSDWYLVLPVVNASLNALCASFLIVGYVLIKKRFIKEHIVAMAGATVSSALFLVSYLLYHHFHGDTKFIAEGFVRPVYFSILISHIFLSIVMVPMVFITLWNALSSNFEKHKKWARWTFPIWLYVSITGVLIFIFLRFLNN